MLFLLAALALIFMERGQGLAAAIAIGLPVAIKPTTAFWPLFLYLAAGSENCTAISLGDARGERGACFSFTVHRSIANGLRR